MQPLENPTMNREKGNQKPSFPNVLTHSLTRLTSFVLCLQVCLRLRPTPLHYTPQLHDLSLLPTAKATSSAQKSINKHYLR